MTIKLPKDFFFGAAMSGPQTEGAWNVGGRLRSYWDMYSDQEINAFFNNVGSYVGNDMYHKYEEDIKLLKSLNSSEISTGIKLADLLKRTELNYDILEKIDPDRPKLDKQEIVVKDDLVLKINDN